MAYFFGPPCRWFRNGIHSLLSRADSTGSADIIYRMKGISLLCRSGIVFDVNKYRSRREYLILTDNIIVLNHIFNLTKKSNLNGRLYYDLTQCFDNLGVAYFLGHPVIITIIIFIDALHRSSRYYTHLSRSFFVFTAIFSRTGQVAAVTVGICDGHVVRAVTSISMDIGGRGPSTRSKS